MTSVTSGMSELGKVFFIINKYSGTGYEPAIEGRIIDRCGELGIVCTIQFTQHSGHATELAKQAVSENFKTVFVMGGDGTINEAAKGLLNTDTALGILPKGSGNGLAGHLGISKNLTRALDLLASHQIISMDTIAINKQLSVNVSGIGFDGHIAGLFGKNGKRGLINYIRLVIREFGRFKEFPMDITIDGKKISRDSFILAFANSSQFGNDARIAPTASVTDQLIDICFIRKVPLLQVFGFAFKMFMGKMEQSEFVDVIKGKKITVELKAPMAFHIDGESHHDEKSFNVEIQPGSLKMIVPKNIPSF
ncbi:MAG: diacylglycerol kinase family protein [Chryseolinea sp.]